MEGVEEWGVESENSFAVGAEGLAHTCTFISFCCSCVSVLWGEQTQRVRGGGGLCSLLRRGGWRMPWAPWPGSPTSTSQTSSRFAPDESLGE